MVTGFINYKKGSSIRCRGVSQTSLTGRTGQIRRRPRLLSRFRIYYDCYRPVIGEADIHVRAELAGLDGAAEVLGKAGDQLLVKRDGYFGPGGSAIGRTISFFRAGKQSELADQQNISLGVLNRAVHHPLIIVKDAKANNFPAQPFGIFGSIGFLNSQ